MILVEYFINLNCTNAFLFYRNIYKCLYTLTIDIGITLTSNGNGFKILIAISYLFNLIKRLTISNAPSLPIYYLIYI